MLAKDLKKAIQIAEKVFIKLEHYLRPGLSEKQIAQFIRKELKKDKSRESFRIIAASGKRSRIPHGFATNKIIEKGEIVEIDFGAYYKGYRSDMTRTYVLGKPNEKQKRIYGILLKAQAAAIKKIKAGVIARDVDNAARSVIEKAGFGKYFIHSTGHGIKYKVHTAPKISGKNKRSIKAGSVVTIEPGIYIKGWGGMRVEDMVLVTKSGTKILTNIPHRLSLT